MNPTALWKSVETWAGRHCAAARRNRLCARVDRRGRRCRARRVHHRFCRSPDVARLRRRRRLVREALCALDPRHAAADRSAASAGAGQGRGAGHAAGLGLRRFTCWPALRSCSRSSRRVEGTTPATVGLLVAWAAGHNVLQYFFARQNNPGAPSAFAIIDDALDRLAEPHQPLLRQLKTALGFAALAGGVALHAFHSGLRGHGRAQARGLRHDGDADRGRNRMRRVGGCLCVPLCGGHARRTARPDRPMAIRAPEPPSRDIERWPTHHLRCHRHRAVLRHVIHRQRAGGRKQHDGRRGTRFKIEVGTIGLLALLAGWGGSGYVVLRHVWAKARERTERAHART